MITTPAPLAALYLRRHPFLGHAIADELAAIAVVELLPQPDLAARRRAAEELLPHSLPALGHGELVAR